jgi:hypothetical protein
MTHRPSQYCLNESSVYVSISFQLVFCYIDQQTYYDCCYKFPHYQVYMGWKHVSKLSQKYGGGGDVGRALDLTLH